MSQGRAPATKKRLNHIVLDLDNTLLIRTGRSKLTTSYDNWFKQQKLMFEYSCWLLDKSQLFTGVLLILPGASEFLQFLFNIPNLKVSFFSAGIEESNMATISILLKRALGADKYNNIKDMTTLYSRHHCTVTSDDIYQKNLATLLQKYETLENILLVDDSEDSIYEDQYDNVFLTEGTGKKNLECKTVDDIFHCNHLFYVTGILKKVFASEEKSLDHVRLLQTNTADKWDYYEEGLKELKKINPHLQFFTNGKDLLPKRRAFEKLDHDIMTRSFLPFLTARDQNAFRLVNKKIQTLFMPDEKNQEDDKTNILEEKPRKKIKIN